MEGDRVVGGGRNRKIIVDFQKMFFNFAFVGLFPLTFETLF